MGQVIPINAKVRRMREQAAEPEMLRQAHRDWLERRAYWQQTSSVTHSGYYRLYGQKGSAPWNATVKRFFGNDVSLFHADAHRATHGS